MSSSTRNSSISAADEVPPARCGLCDGDPVGPRVTLCGPNFCARCLTSHLEREKSRADRKRQRDRFLLGSSHSGRRPTCTPSKKLRPLTNEPPKSAESDSIQFQCPQTGCHRVLSVPNWNIENFPPISTLSVHLKQEKEVQILATPPVCPRHSKLEELFCDTCRIQICSECVDDHGFHKIFNWKSAIKLYNGTQPESHKKTRSAYEKISDDGDEIKLNLRKRKWTRTEKLESLCKEFDIELREVKSTGAAAIATARQIENSSDLKWTARRVLVAGESDRQLQTDRLLEPSDSSDIGSLPVATGFLNRVRAALPHSNCLPIYAGQSAASRLFILFLPPSPHKNENSKYYLFCSLI